MPNPLFDTLNTSSLRIFPTTLSKAAAVSTNVSCTFRHLPFGALSFLSKTSFFFTLPQRQTYPSVPAKTPPLSKTFDDPLIKLCGRRRSWMITLFSAWLPHPLFPNWHSKENFLPNQKWRPREATRLTPRWNDLHECFQGQLLSLKKQGSDMDRRKRGRGGGRRGAQPGEGVKNLASWSCRGGFITNRIVSPGPQSKTWDQAWARSHVDSATQESEVPINPLSKEGSGYLEKGRASARETLGPWAKTMKEKQKGSCVNFLARGGESPKNAGQCSEGKESAYTSAGARDQDAVHNAISHFPACPAPSPLSEEEGQKPLWTDLWLQSKGRNKATTFLFTGCRLSWMACLREGDLNLSQVQKLAYYMRQIIPSAATRMVLNIVILSEVSHTQKDKYHMISLRCGI